ncbi:hypothetical protein QUA51_09445 [Microcoleus sp. Pol10_D6]|uniref:hypothetical protein n=1 Tax=Microcoleus sp. Pol10_D6 TaxID=2818875 RepID=UPI002FD70EA3
MVYTPTRYHLTPTHAPNLEECGRYTLYARKPSPHCIGKLSNYFAFPFGQGRAAGFVRDETQSASMILSWMRSLHVRGECAHPP